MSSPIAHIAAGYAVYSAFRRKLPDGPVCGVPSRIAWPMAVITLCMLPDLDVIAAWILGSLEKYHNNFSHSLPVAIAVSIVLAVALRVIAGLNLRTGFLLVLTCCLSHLLIDLCTIGRGVMLFWPFTEVRLHSPVTLFIGVPWSTGLTNPYYLLMVLNDACFAAAIVAIVVAVQKKSQKPESRTQNKEQAV